MEDDEDEYDFLNFNFASEQSKSMDIKDQKSNIIPL
jgi:hypothetical protein